MASKRPRANQRPPSSTCYNCGRSGVLPGPLLADEAGNHFCTHECGWSYLLAEKQPVQARTQPAPEPDKDDEVVMRQQFAHAERVQQIMLRNLHRDPRYRQVMKMESRKRTRPPSPPPTSDEPTYFTFTNLFTQ